MKGLSADQHKIREILNTGGIPCSVYRDWDFEYLSVPVTVDALHNRTVSARFGLISDGVPILTELPKGSYLCVRIPDFYLFWDDLNKFPHILQEANAIARTLTHRDAYMEFFIDYVHCDTIFFRMEVPLGENESLEHAVPDVYHQLTAIAAAVYAFLEKLPADDDEEADQV